MRQASIMRAGAAGMSLAVCLAHGRRLRRLKPGRSNSGKISQLPQIWLRQRRLRSAAPETVAGGRLHGVVKSGTIPLPGVTVTAQNTLTGKRYSTTTDITGAWQMNIPQNGRYVIRTQFAAFAQGSQEAISTRPATIRLVNFELILASRQAALDQQQANQQGNVAARFAKWQGNRPKI